MANSNYNSWFSLCMYVCKSQRAPLCAPIGVPFMQYGVVYGMCTWGVGVGLSNVVMSFANWLTISFPIILVCTMTFCIVMLWVDHMIWLTTTKISSLLGWLCWNDRCLVWLYIRWMLSRLFVNTKTYYEQCLAVVRAINKALIFFP